jgi:putative transposase
VTQIIGYLKGKSSIWIAQNVERKMRNFLGHKFWARGYFVTTVGRDEEMIRGLHQKSGIGRPATGSA